MHGLMRAGPAVWFLAAVLAVGLTGAATASPIIDPTGDFNLPFYTGSQTGAYDVVSAGGRFNGSTFHLFATLAGPVAGSPGDPIYVWGIQRGPIAPPGPFAGVGNPNVVFNSVFTLTGAGVTNNPAVVGNVNGNYVEIFVPLSLVPSTGFLPQNYLWNLWPRDRSPPNVGSAQISDFAPNNAMAAFETPEPISLVVFGGLLVGGGLIARKRLMKKAMA